MTDSLIRDGSGMNTPRSYLGGTSATTPTHACTPPSEQAPLSLRAPSAQHLTFCSPCRCSRLGLNRQRSLHRILQLQPSGLTVSPASLELLLSFARDPVLEPQHLQEPLSQNSGDCLREHVCWIVLSSNRLQPQMSFLHSLLYPQVPRLNVSHPS